ncbi:MAG: DUF711 family protein [Chloroflexi bacterium]|nr:DUF711 family protein [Chloroflexota bacterium]
MKIRSITYFCNPKYPLDENTLRAAGDFLAQAKAAYQAAGYEVQTTRLATIPFPKLLGEERIDDLPKLAEQLAKAIQDVGVAYASFGPALPDMPRSYEVIPEAISASENIFFGGTIADDAKIYMSAVKACADVIVKSAATDPNGFANLRFAALANVRAGAPFFPAAYHEGYEPVFAIATEAADLAVQAFENATSLENGRNALISEITKHGRAIARVAADLAELPITNHQSPSFGGIDFSLAPFPDNAHSLGVAVEKMGILKIGLHGSLAAAAILTEAVDRADFPHTGFSGFMQPVLEDSVLAFRAAEGTLTIKDLLLYSTVCGTGLDTVPLPGDTTPGQLVPLLLDLSALALRLNKPLTARLMPVPGKKAGDATTFDFGFFANSKVMSLEADALSSPLNGREILQLKGR